MPDFAAPVERLIDELKHLPGIGQKTAQRLAFHLLRAARKTHSRSPKPSATPRKRFAPAPPATTLPTPIRACTVSGRTATSEPSASSKSRTTSWPLKKPAPTTACTTSWAVRFLLYKDAARISCNIKCSDRTSERRHGRRNHHRHQSHRRRRSHRHLSFKIAEAAGRSRDAHRRGHSRSARISNMPTKSPC